MSAEKKCLFSAEDTDDRPVSKTTVVAGLDETG